VRVLRRFAVKSTASSALFLAEQSLTIARSKRREWPRVDRRPTLALRMSGQRIHDEGDDTVPTHAAMSSLRRTFLYVLFAIAAATTACHSGRVTPKDLDPTLPTTIEIDNQDFNDMTIYVVRSGQRTRLGVANGNKKTTLTIPAYMINGTAYLRFLADPIGGDRKPVSEEIDVSAGDQLVMIINSAL
jgi:hypothetical protein